MKKIFKYLLKSIAGRNFFYPLFKALHSVSIIGLNYGNADIATNGELNFLKRLANQFKKEKKEQLVLFDVGANKGEYSIFLNDIFKNFRSQIYAFEPSITTYKQLGKTITDFPNIQAVCAGLSNQTTTATLFSSTENDTLASLYKRDILIDNSSAEVIEEVVHLTTLDEFCEKNNIETIDLLKIDVEGNELKVLEGATKMLQSKRINCIQFEFGGTAIDARTFLKDYVAFFEKYDFEFGRILRDSELPILEYNEHIELFHYSNFFAKKQ